MRAKVLFFISVFLLFVGNSTVFSWGFFAHQRINRLAVFTLPTEMLAFYKYHINYVTENAVNPDRRRYSVPEEAPRHYIDLDVYGDSALYLLPRYWNEAVAKYTEDTLNAYGIVPWYINLMKYKLTLAFKEKDAKAILRLSADIGHYIADANVPLHTTENYNGQLTNQKGIHGFWESRLPELFSDSYDYFVGPSEYLPQPQLEAWEAVTFAHLALDSVFRFEKELTAEFPEDKKYVYDERGATLMRNYSRDFSLAYHERLAGQVERRMRASVKMVGDFWYTCWVDAGQPNLDELLKPAFSKEELEKEQEELKQRKKELEGIREEGGLAHIFGACDHSSLAWHE
ncbi:zinc dependent phospholipase C family protein [Cytophagales bacterium LB-30]|uniref:Zinc dependent phospholipase C family protein n=1 Tax=Shiella aurantiaca TaxID=3058365 RepID=A0ABT8F3Q1_9BACT|nr:zinc dependent phospholipase C family protein [Shiella aurantiaca]MDN4164846.1 zinc dependent phospholipase C family protein [Shiella aurantiaca]